MCVSLRAVLCLSSSILEAADAEQMLASVSAVERDPELLDDDAEGDAAAAPGEPDGDEDRRDEDLRMAAAVLEASPDDVRARLGHEDEVPLAVDSILNWELGEELIASGFGHAEPASAEDTIEEHPEAIARHWADAALTSLQALEWAGSERCQSHRDSAENTVALVATAVSTEPGGVTTHVARWMTFNNQTTWEGRFVRVSARQNYRIEYTMPDGKELFGQRISSGAITFVIPNTRCTMIRPLHLREEMHPSAVRVCSMINGIDMDSHACFICGKADNTTQCAFCLLCSHGQCLDADVDRALRAQELFAETGVDAAKILGEPAPHILQYSTNVMCMWCEQVVLDATS